MMNDTVFLDGREAITNAIRQLISDHPGDSPILMVVAFVGQGIEGLIQPGKTYKLVCNLAAGGTNPVAIERLLDLPDSRIEIKHLPTLHAKVVMAAGGAVVSSANFSAWGLDLGDSTAGWLEAGVFLPLAAPAYARVNRWAWDLWMSAEDVTPEVMLAAFDSYQRAGRGAIPTEADLEESTQTALEPSGDFGLTEAVLFRPLNKQNPNNALRAGSDQMGRLYGEFLGREPSRRDSWIVSYVANLLWTHVGNAMDWREGTFRRPTQVVKRWRDKKVKDEKILDFLVWLSTAQKAPVAVRGACQHLYTESWGDYVGGAGSEG